MGTGVPVDSALSTTSTNPVQNKVLTNIIGTGSIIIGNTLIGAVNSIYSSKAERIIISGTYNSDATYAVGDCCLRAIANTYRLYRCIVAIETPEAWTAGHWTETTVAIELAKKYEKPSGGIPDADITSAATWNAKGTYSKPAGGIPKTDLASTVQTSLGKADSAYQKPSGGIPKTDLASTVQTSLGKADTALQSVPSTYRTATAQDVIDAGKQAKINVSGLLKGNGNGSVSAATAGTDYETPAGAKTLGITGAAVGDLVRVAAVDASGKPTSWSHVPLCNIATNPNMLDNWYFIRSEGNRSDGKFPINQRGQGNYPGNVYGIDRWLGASASVTVTASYNKYLVVKSSDDGAQNALIQYLEDKESFAGKTVTISAIISSQLVQSTISIPANSSEWGGTIGSGSTAVHNCSIYFKYLNSKFCFVFYLGSEYVKNNNILIQAAKLEIGSEQTLAHKVGSAWVLNEVPDYETQLIKCQTSKADPSDTYANGIVPALGSTGSYTATGTYGTNTAGVDIYGKMVIFGIFLQPGDHPIPADTYTNIGEVFPPPKKRTNSTAVNSAGVLTLVDILESGIVRVYAYGSQLTGTLRAQFMYLS